MARARASRRASCSGAGRRRGHTRRRVNRVARGPGRCWRRSACSSRSRCPSLGSGAWPFEPPSVDPRGILGPLVRVADREWDLGILRSTAVPRRAPRRARRSGQLARSAPGRAGPRSALAALVVRDALVPASLLQVGLRDATAPWYFTNDSTYQIELAGDLVLDGDNPYGHDYDGSGLERFYPAADDQAAALRPVGARPLRLLPRDGADRGRLAAPARARRTTTGSSSCSRPSRCSRRRCSSPPRSRGGSPSAPGSPRTRSSSTAPGSGPPTPRRSCARPRLRAGHASAPVWAAASLGAARRCSSSSRSSPSRSSPSCSCRACPRRALPGGAAFAGVFSPPCSRS